MRNRARHPLHRTFWRRPLPNQVDYSRNPAHDAATIAEDAVEESREMQ